MGFETEPTGYAKTALSKNLRVRVNDFIPKLVYALKRVETTNQ